MGREQATGGIHKPELASSSALWSLASMSSERESVELSPLSACTCSERLARCVPTQSLTEDLLIALAPGMGRWAFGWKAGATWKACTAILST